MKSNIDDDIESVTFKIKVVSHPSPEQQDMVTMRNTLDKLASGLYEVEPIYPLDQEPVVILTPNRVISGTCTVADGHKFICKNCKGTR